MILHGLAVQQRPDAQRLGVGNVVGRHQNRPQRAEGVETLAPDPLASAPLELPGARRDVVAAGVAENEIEGVRLRGAAAAPADDDGKLAFVVGLLAVLAGRQTDRIPGMGQGAGRLHEHDRAFGDVDTRLFGVLPVVEADAENVYRVDRGQQFGDLPRLTCRRQPGVQVSGQQRRAAAVSPFPETCLTFLVDEPDDAHPLYPRGSGDRHQTMEAVPNTVKHTEPPWLALIDPACS